MEKAKEKKEYIPPRMEIIELNTEAPLLSCSNDGDAYWSGCHEGWQGGWGED